MLRLLFFLIIFIPEISQAAICTSTTVGANICSALLPAKIIAIDLFNIANWIALGLISFGFILFAGFKVYGSFNSRKVAEWSSYQSDTVHFSNDEYDRKTSVDAYFQYLEDKEAFDNENPEFEGSHDESDRSNQVFQGSHDDHDRSELFDRNSLDYDGTFTTETEDEREDRIEQEKIDDAHQTLYFTKEGELVDVNGQVVSEDAQLEADIDVYSSKGELSYSVRDGQAIDVDSGEVIEYLPKEEVEDNLKEKEEEIDNGWSYTSQESETYEETEDEYQDRMQQAMIDYRNSR